MQNLGHAVANTHFQLHLCAGRGCSGSLDVIMSHSYSLIMSHVSDRERQLVIGFTREGISAARIALQVNCSLRTMRKVRKRSREMGEWPRKVGSSGAPEKTMAQRECGLGRLVHTVHFASLGELTNRFSQTTALSSESDNRQKAPACHGDA